MNEKKLLELSKMILLNILENVAIYLCKYFVSHIMVIPWNDTFLYYRKNQVSLWCIINFTKSLSDTNWLVLQFVIFSTVKTMFTKLILDKEMDDDGSIREWLYLLIFFSSKIGDFRHLPLFHSFREAPWMKIFVFLQPMWRQEQSSLSASKTFQPQGS